MVVFEVTCCLLLLRLYPASLPSMANRTSIRDWLGAYFPDLALIRILMPNLRMLERTARLANEVHLLSALASAIAALVSQWVE